LRLIDFNNESGCEYINMNTSDVIFKQKPSELWGRALFLFLSVIFHLILAHYFYTAKFAIDEIKTEKKVVFIRPVSSPVVFPNLDKKKPPETSPSNEPPPEIIPVDTDAALTDNGTTGKNVTVPDIPVPVDKQRTTIKPDYLRIPTTAPGRERLKAPLKPSHYLKRETLDEILRRAERELQEKKGITADSSLAESPSTVSPYDNDSIVIDPTAMAYFKSKGIDITPWARKVVERINGNWSILPGFGTSDGSAGGEVGIAVVFDPEGKVVSADVKRSSNLQYMDRAALNAIQMSAPFPTPPGRFPGGQLKVFFLFNYENI
jgi:TonB family protein